VELKSLPTPNVCLMPFVQALKYRKVFEEAIQPHRVEARLWLDEEIEEAQIKLLGFAEGTDEALKQCAPGTAWCVGFSSYHKDRLSS